MAVLLRAGRALLAVRARCLLTVQPSSFMGLFSSVRSLITALIAAVSILNCSVHGWGLNNCW